MNKRQNYSRKREAILDTLRSTKTHPTAEWVYLQLKSQYPDLSLGTVYRNLSQFKEDGTIVSLGVVNGQEHFDGDISPHSHFICSHCGSVLDVPNEPNLSIMFKRTSLALDAQIESCHILFRGICSDCMKKQ